MLGPLFDVRRVGQMCEQCASLRSAYKASVEAYSQATRTLRGTRGDDYTAVLRRVQVLRDKSQDRRRQLDEHWFNRHSLESVLHLDLFQK